MVNVDEPKTNIDTICMALGIIVLSICILGMQSPSPWWTTKVKVLSVYDGDTVVVEVRRTMRVRLLDCWAPEIRTKDLEQKRKGFASRDYLRGLIEGKEVVLVIPSNSPDIGKTTSLSRVLGNIYLPGESEPVSASLIKAGHATKEKK